ncbi:MAG: response regulator [Gammaproteobacteria bacterium]|nr:response regulator [Gammaproteobacteria bacterium]
MSSAAKNWIDYAGWVAFSLAAGVRSMVASKRADDRDGRLAWGLFGIAALLWCAGNLYLIVGELTSPVFISTPTPANYLFLGYALLFIAGLYFLRSDRSDRSHSIIRIADMVTIGCAVLLSTAIIMVEPLLNSDETLGFLLFAIADPASFIIASLIALTFLWTQDLGELRAIFVLLFISIAVHTLANITFFTLSLETTAPSSLAVVWMLAFSIQYLAAYDYDHRRSGIKQQVLIPTPKLTEAMQALLPAALIISILVVALLFRENLTQVVLLIVLMLATLFAIALGFREWAIDRKAKHLIEELRRADDLNSYVLSASPSVIFAAQVADNFPITFVSDNFRTVLGVEPKNFPQQDFIHPGDRTLLRTQLSNLLRFGVADSEFRLIDRGEQTRWMYGKFVVARDAAGEPIEIIGSLSDISEKKTLQSRMHQTQRLESLGKLSGSIAHDFNNLLTAVLGYSELTLDSDELPAKHRKHIQEIKNAGERGAALTRQLLAFSGRHTLIKQNCDLIEVINGMTGMLERLIGDSVSMSIQVSPGMIQVNADRGQIEQVLMNLILNARDAMQADGQVTIGLEKIFLDQQHAAELAVNAGPYAILSVEDNGPGIEEELLEGVFEPFFSTKEKHEGTGLGLSIVHGIVEQHGGTVTVDSKPGDGCNFKVYLPAIEDESLLDQGARPPKELPRGNETLLVVDDETAITDVILQTLQPLGYTVLTANNSRDALGLAEDRSAQLLLTDVIMPDCNGAELRENIQAIQPGIKCAYMSGYTDRTSQFEEFSEDSTPFLEKPLSLTSLARAVRDLLDSNVGGHSNASPAGF